MTLVHPRATYSDLAMSECLKLPGRLLCLGYVLVTVSSVRLLLNDDRQMIV